MCDGDGDDSRKCHVCGWEVAQGDERSDEMRDGDGDDSRKCHVCDSVSCVPAMISACYPRSTWHISDRA